jgi:hypothetical protein
VPSTSLKQAHFMNAAAHNPAFALKAGIPVSVARDFHNADKNKAKTTGQKPLWAKWQGKK